MRYRDSIFGSLLEPIDRRQFQRVVDGLDGDAYDKSFRSWDHLVALIYAQLSGVEGLRALGPTAVTLSGMEGLDAHGNAVKVRLDALAEGRA